MFELQSQGIIADFIDEVTKQANALQLSIESKISTGDVLEQYESQLATMPEKGMLVCVPFSKVDVGQTT